MAKINKKELAQMGTEQLNNKFVELKKELMKLNMQRSTGTPPENPGMVRATRKTIARIHTYITQKKNEIKKEALKQKKDTPKLNAKKKTKTEVKDKKE